MSGPPIWTFFADQRKEASSSVEEASQSGNWSDPGNASLQQLLGHWFALLDLLFIDMLCFGFILVFFISLINI